MENPLRRQSGARAMRSETSTGSIAGNDDLIKGLRAQVRLSILPGEMRDVAGETIRFGGDAACEVSVDSTIYPEVAGTHARIEMGTEGLVLVPLALGSQTLLNGTPVQGTIPIFPGDRVTLGKSGPTVELISIEPTGFAAAGPIAGYSQTFRADVRHRALLRGSESSERFEIGGGGVIGREARSAQFHLDHPHVSRWHALLSVEGRRVVINDLESSNGTFVNGRQINRATTLVSGDRIDIGPFSIEFDGSALVSRSRSNNIELVASGLRRVVNDRASGAPLALLDDVNVVVRPREFVCVLGPSGSGKSTLLAILSGRNPPSTGSVLLNGEDLYADFEALKGDIAVVPQRDVLHDTLALGAALRYTAQLRLPSDHTRDDLEASVSDILEVVGLASRRGMLIKQLSGGQTKRASLANELVARPSLLFLDEVTSGLDEQTDREVMELFRQVADGGKTVVCITHTLANVDATCHLVVILTEGGRLAFVGTPDEAKAYFGMARLGDVYQKLAERTPREWHDRFRSSVYFQRYVADRLPPGAAQARPARQAQEQRRPAGASALRQCWVLTRRYVAIWRGDRQALMALVAQSVLVSLLLCLVFGRLSDVSNPLERGPRTENLLNLMVVSCFWFGCNTAAKELVKERIIFHRERDYNLRVMPYIVSKFLVLTFIGALQATMLFAIVRSWCGPPGAVAAQWVTVTALAVAGTAVGLLLSSLARTEEVATALVPIAVIPQIILAGLVAPLKGLMKAIARIVVTVYWGQQAVEHLLPNDVVTVVVRENVEWFSALAVVVGHALVAALCTILVLWFTGGKRGRT
jgi:ABC-type multidrug transport system ATPase subunit